MLQSKMARRLVRLFVLIIAVPVIVTAIALQNVGHEQIILTAHTMEKINRDSVKEAGAQFQRLGQEAMRQSSEQTQATSSGAVTSVTQKIATIQSDSLTKTAHELSDLTSASFDGAMRQSLHTHNTTLDSIRKRMAQQFFRSAQQTQQHAAGNIERAMLALDDAMMRERAAEMARQLTDHIRNAPVFLQFTAQMPDMRDGNVAGQKATLDALVRRLPEFLTVSVLDKTGHETAISASDHLVTEADLGAHAQETYFQQALQGQTFTGVDTQPLNGAPVLRFAVPIEAYRGKVVGVIAARYSLESLWETIRRTRIGKRGYATVVDAAQHPLLLGRTSNEPVLTAVATVNNLNWSVVVCVPRIEAMQPIEALKSDIKMNAQRATLQMQEDIQHTAAAVAANLQISSSAVRDSALQQMKHRFEEAFQSVTQTTSTHTRSELALLQQTVRQQTHTTQRTTNRKMVQASEETSQNVAEKMQPMMQSALERADRRLSILALIIMVVFCGLGWALALLTANRIVQPVMKLVSVTQSIAEGDLDKRMDANAPDEIGDLAIAFNTMAARLQQSRSELNEAEAQLVQSAKLASLGTLSAGVAHELNQPVAIIRGVAQQLQDEPGLTGEVLDDLKLIEGQTSRMTKIIQHLRTFCRAGSVEKVQVDVHEVINNCLMFVGAQLQAHGVKAVLELGKTPLFVTGDANELEQVFLNLITNARDALEGREDACITIRTSLVGETASIEFADNGPGIPEEIAARIFDPFFTTKEPGKGTGLGLSISHNIIKKHGGQIVVASRAETNRGAVFTLTIPLCVLQANSFKSDSYELNTADNIENCIDDHLYTNEDNIEEDNIEEDNIEVKYREDDKERPHDDEQKRSRAA